MKPRVASMQKKLFRLLCTERTVASEHGSHVLYTTRVLGGPLRGTRFNMPGLERFSFCLGRYERPVVQRIAEHLRAGDVGYDVGANAGYLTMLMARCVGKSGRVFAFEPAPRSLAALRQNVLQNNVENVTIVPKAVNADSAPVSFATFEYSLVNHIVTDQTPGDAQVISVGATSLDDFVYAESMPPPTLIKIDVEGAEKEVFDGADRVLREARPIVLAEIREGAGWDSIMERMNAYGYQGTPISGGWDLQTDGLADVLFLPK